MYDFSLSACALLLLRLRLKKNRARRSEMRTPPIKPPMIGFLSMVVEELGEELDELPDGKLVDVGVLFEDVEYGASC